MRSLFVNVNFWQDSKNICLTLISKYAVKSESRSRNFVGDRDASPAIPTYIIPCSLMQIRYLAGYAFLHYSQNHLVSVFPSPIDTCSDTSGIPVDSDAFTCFTCTRANSINPVTKHNS